MHRIINYGSFLQAYALKKTIESFGYAVEFIDYHYEKSLIQPKNITIMSKMLKNRDIINYIKRKTYNKRFKRVYKEVLSEYLKVGKYPNYTKSIDCLVIGSDEVFNCIQGYPVGYSRELFGKGFDNVKIITYAASFGYATYSDLKKYKIVSEITDLLNGIETISVRDENTYNIISKLTNVLPIQHLDPVLITNFENEIKNIKVNKGSYIVIYAYEGRLEKSEEDYIKQFAKAENKKIISVGFYQKIADYNLVLSPFEALAYIKNADYVITDTFHGTIFSIKMESNFCTIIRKSNENKLLTLLEKLKLETRRVKSTDDIKTLYTKKIDYSEVEKIINKESKRAIKYLKDNL